jgi:DNA modification methylase
MLIPSRLAIEMQSRGWILRQDIIWHKVSGLPSTANDRFNSKYEHIFMFAKEPYYFFDTAKARKPYKENSLTRKLYKQASLGGTGIIKCASNKGDSEPTFVPANDKGALKDDVWELHTANTNLKHFAAFSGDLVEECIKPGCAKECCDICGKPKMEKYNIINRKYEDLTPNEIKIWNSIDTMEVPEELKIKMRTKVLKKKISLGFIQSCKCKSPSFSPGIVFDPFCGTGTTVVRAKQLGYNYCGIEMKPEYFVMINKRLDEMLI